MYIPYGFDYYAKQLSKNGITSIGMDLRGFGKSEGYRGYAGTLDNIIDDNIKFIEFLKQKNSDIASLPIFLMGHSMGALSCVYMMYRYPKFARGMILLSPPFHPKGGSPMIRRFLIPLIPWVHPFRKFGVGKFRHEPGAPIDDAVKMLKRDPLIYKGRLLFVYYLL